MLKKIGLAALITLLAGALLTGFAFAKGEGNGKQIPSRDPNHRMVVGEILEIGSSEFSVKGLNGELYTILVSEETVFRTRNEDGGSEASFADLEIGMYVSVNNHEDSNGDFSARLVVLLPEDFDPSKLKGKRAVGEVDMVTSGGGFFKMTTRDGEKLTIVVDENTRFAGYVDGLDDMEKGDKVGVLALEQEDGSLLAKAVLSRKVEPKLDKQAGSLTGINEQTITLTDRNEESHTFTVTDETRFASRDGSVESFDDLEIDMILIVLFTNEDPTTAKAVTLVDEAILNLERAVGEIQSVGTNQITLLSNGETLVFSVDENTRIQGSQIDSLNDLSEGMKVGVLYQTEDDGTLTAKAIITGRQKPGNDQP